MNVGTGGMRKSIVSLLVASVVLTSCGTFLNPRNWFGRSEAADTASADAEAVNPLIPRRTGVRLRLSGSREEEVDTTTPITAISDIRVERVPGGAIIRVTGTDPVAGIYNAKLVPVNDDELPEDGVLSYQLLRDTIGIRTNGSERQRQVVVARRVSDITLRGVTTIRVEAKSNARQVRR